MSSEVDTSGSDQDLKALEDFVVGNEDLERLEALLDRFNIFEAIGVVRQELRHSDFLAFLLDPQANHGLGDAFVKKFLQRISTVEGNGSLPVVTPIELELWDLGRIEVRREWRHIDILLLDHDHELAIIIENKIGTGERSGQLQRYSEAVGKDYPGWNMMKVYLTPAGDLPSREDYFPVGYGTVCEVIDGLVGSRAAVMNPEVNVIMTHYIDVIRRHIVEDSEIARLSRQIYQKHKRALDVIYEHRPDIKAEIKAIIDNLVSSEPGLVLTGDEQRITKTSFSVRAWDTPLLMSSEYSKDKRILSFQLWNYPHSLELVLFVKPGPQDIRQKLFEIVEANPNVLKFSRSWGDWTLIFTRELLGREMYEGTVSEDREAEIRKNWTDFLEKDLTRIDAALKREAWIWEPVETDPEESGEEP